MGEQQHIPDGGGIGQQHHQPVDADTLARRGRQAVFQRADVIVIDPSGLGAEAAGYSWTDFGIDFLSVGLIAADILVGGPTGEGIAPAMVLQAGRRSAGSSFDNLVRAAQQQFPSKAGIIQQHHVVPKYLGGAANGKTVPLDAAYHQQITNEFRRLWPYGGKNPTAQELERVMRQVYERRAQIPSATFLRDNVAWEKSTHN